MERVALVGYGQWGRNIAKNLRKLHTSNTVDFVAVVEPDNDKLLLCLAKSHTGLKGYNSISELTKNEYITKFILAAPPVVQPELVIHALNSGADVLAQKPLALNYIDAVRLDYEAKKLRRTLWVDHTPLYDPMYRRLLHKLKVPASKTDFGNIKHISSTRINYAPGRVELLGCGAIWDMASHDLAIIDVLTGSRALSVRTYGNHQQATMLIAYEDFSASITAGQDGPDKVRLFSITQENRVLTYDAVTRKCNHIELSPEDLEIEPMYYLIKDFVTNSGKYDPMCPGSSLGVEVVKILDAAERSMDTRREVEIQ